MLCCFTLVVLVFSNEMVVSENVKIFRCKSLHSGTLIISLSIQNWGKVTLVINVIILLYMMIMLNLVPDSTPT